MSFWFLTLVFFCLAVGVVGGFVHELVEFRRVGHLDFDNPVGVGVLIDQTGVVDELLVDFDDGAAHGGDEVGGGLDALYRTEVFACGDVVALFGHVNVDHVAEGFLGVVGDADEGDVVRECAQRFLN